MRPLLASQFFFGQLFRNPLGFSPFLAVDFIQFLFLFILLSSSFFCPSSRHQCSSPKVIPPRPQHPPGLLARRRIPVFGSRFGSKKHFVNRRVIDCFACLGALIWISLTATRFWTMRFFDVKGLCRFLFFRLSHATRVKTGRGIWKGKRKLKLKVPAWMGFEIWPPYQLHVAICGGKEQEGSRVGSLPRGLPRFLEPGSSIGRKEVEVAAFIEGGPFYRKGEDCTSLCCVCSI